MSSRRRGKADQKHKRAARGGLILSRRGRAGPQHQPLVRPGSRRIPPLFRVQLVRQALQRARASLGNSQRVQSPIRSRILGSPSQGWMSALQPLSWVVSATRLTSSPVSRREPDRPGHRRPSDPEGHKNLGSGPVTRSFFELLDLRRLRGHDGDSELSIGRDTCFVNIVRPHRTQGPRSSTSLDGETRW
jgi:hypothetical protein